MALSFLYLAFVRILQLLRLLRRGRDELAIEVAMDRRLRLLTQRNCEHRTGSATSSMSTNWLLEAFG